jgi:hypothetical protein
MLDSSQALHSSTRTRPHFEQTGFLAGICNEKTAHRIFAGDEDVPPRLRRHQEEGRRPETIMIMKPQPPAEGY